VKSKSDLSFDEHEASQRRTRTALLVLLAGTAILLATVGLAMLRVESPDASVTDGAPAPLGDADTRASARAATVVLVYGSILLVVFIVAAIALVTASRNFRRGLAKKRQPPTPADDVWSKHKLPEEEADTDESPTSDQP
jgi:putative copper export protein